VLQIKSAQLASGLIVIEFHSYLVITEQAKRAAAELESDTFKDTSKKLVNLHHCSVFKVLRLSVFVTMFLAGYAVIVYILTLSRAEVSTGYTWPSRCNLNFNF